LEQAEEILQEYKIEKLPIVDEDQKADWLDYLQGYSEKKGQTPCLQG
jgi:CBS domain-containing protein